MADDRFSGKSQGVWGTRRTLRDGSEVPVVCVLGGSGRITQIYPGTGAVMLKHRKEFIELLRAQRDQVTPHEQEDDDVPPIKLGGLDSKRKKKRKKKKKK